MPYLNVHVLKSVPASNLNRDDTGSPKTMLYGERNAKRVRLSSQSIKRAVKDALREKNLSVGSLLTRSFPATFREIFLSNGYAEDVSLKYASLLVTLFFNMKTETVKDQEGNVRYTVASAFSLGQEDYDDIVSAVETFAKDASTKPTMPSKISNAALIELSERISGTLNFEVNAFGRMNANKTSMNVEATFAVAHAFTVGNAPSQSDYLIAKDDLTESTGAAAMVDAEFGTGTFYEYATVNVDEFLDRQPEDRKEKAVEFIRNFVTTFAKVLPSGKQASSAAFTPADVVLITITDSPASYASAFFTPIVRDVWEQSTKALAEEADHYAAFGLDTREFWFARGKLASLVEGRENSEVFSTLAGAVDAAVGSI